MNSNYISTESINIMDVSELARHIQEFVFLGRKSMKDGEYHSIQNLLQRLHQIGEEKSFKSHCKKYSILFIEACPVINLPPSGESCPRMNDCAHRVEIGIKCKSTRLNNVYLHPLLADFINSGAFGTYCPCFNEQDLKDFLKRRAPSNEGDVGSLHKYLCDQYYGNLQPIIDAAETSFEFSQNSRCDQTKKYFKSDRKLFLHKILKAAD